MSSLYLGLDSSTQSLSAVLIDLDARELVYEATVGYDADLPAYGTRNGVLVNPDPKVVHAPPLMWAEALDLLFTRMKADEVALDRILAVSGSGQQHGSVYLNGDARRALADLPSAPDLATALRNVFSRPTSPIWMDSSTHAECTEIRDALGGLQATAQATGSTTFERFTGPQIRKFWKTEPAAYEETAHVALVSSFMASLLAGRIAPIDHGDGAGMNLMDISRREWHPGALEATAPDLARRLPPLAESWTVVGPVSRYFVDRFGLNPDAQALVWSGDNPNSVVGLGLIREGMVAISLGTSDTCFGTMQACRTDPRGEGHVFVSPTGDYMSLICYKNGSLARERVRQAYGLDWDGFSQALRDTPPGNDGGIMLPWFEPEIVPNVLEPGVRRYGLDEKDAARNCRAVVEAQMMSMRLHSEWMGVRPTEIYVTGGASANAEILQVMADVHGCAVHRFEVTNSAALGAAMRAAHGHLLAAGRPAEWTDLSAGLAEPVPGSAIRPRPETRGVYDHLMRTYAAREAEALGRPGSATPAGSWPVSRARVDRVLRKETPLSRRYLKVLQNWVPLGVRYFQDWPVRPDCGHFFGGCSWYGHETASPALAFAVVASSPDFDPKVCGCSREEIREMALKAIRYLCFTHDSGPADCVRPEKGLGRPENCGTKWGERGKGFFRESQCGRYVAKMGIAALLLDDAVDDETWDMVAAVHADYAERFAGMAPRSGIYTNTQMEENAWTSTGLAAVACLLRDHPSAGTWSEAARRWMYFTVTVPQDTKNHALRPDGRTVGRTVGETFTALPDYWTENHGMVHPTYTASCMEFLSTIAVVYGLHGQPVPGEALFNRQEVYDRLKVVIDRNGYMHPVQGMDWPYLFADPGSQHHSAASLVLRDPDAARLERRALETLERRVAGFGGRLTDPDVAEVCHTVQDPLIMVETNIGRPGLAYLSHRLYGDGPRPTPDDQLERKLRGASGYPHAGFAFNRHRAGQTSFSWRNSVMALPLNRDGICTVAPASNTFLGSISVRNRPDSQQQVSLHVDRQQNGFAAALVMDRAQGAVRQEVLFASLPSGISLSLERFLANQAITVERVDQGFLRIVNERFPEMTGNCDGYRVLHTPDGKRRFEGGASPDPDSDLVETCDHPAWVNVDGRLGTVFSGTGKTVYHNRHYFSPWWAVADDLTLSRQDRPARVKAGDTVARLAALLAPDASPAKTAALSLVELSAKGSAAGLIGDGHLAAANFGRRAAALSLSCPRGSLEAIPVFDGETRVGKTRVTYRRRLEAGQAILQKCILTVTAKGELHILAADGVVCLHNTGDRQAVVTVPDRDRIRIRPGATAWLD